ncbi:MAG: peptidylprolyl isomerase [Sedimentisphaerales bacterium]|nr:peptidylprolyl isomerase [Sedimentisphaerales bacterium]
MALYVNGEKIDDKEIQAEAEKLRPRYEQVFSEMPAEDRETQLMDWSRENVIEAVLMRQAALRDIPEPPAEIIEHAYENLIREAGGKEQFFENTGLSTDQEEQIKADLSQRLRMERQIAQITSQVSQPTEKEIKKYYEKNVDRFTIPEMIRASHIVRHPTPATDPEAVKSEMRQVLVELRAGADFSEMAAQHSDCPDNSGDLGFFARGQMVQAFDDVVFTLEPGDISEVFQTEFGYHIASVKEKKPAIPCPLEEVREVIVKDLTEQAQQKALEKFVDAEKEKATIEDK